MNKKKRSGLGKYLYMEWMIPIKDYYFSIEKNTVFFEILIPLIISLFCTVTYFFNCNLSLALDGLAHLLPTAISILIGFTVMLITLLLTSSGYNIESLKKIETGKRLYNKPITLYQGLHIQFSHTLFSEIFLLLLVFLYLFLKGICISVRVSSVVLFAEIYLTLNILFSILRGVTGLYFSFYHDKR